MTSLSRVVHANDQMWSLNGRQGMFGVDAPRTTSADVIDLLNREINSARSHRPCGFNDLRARVFAGSAADLGFTRTLGSGTIQLKPMLHVQNGSVAVAHRYKSVQASC